MRAPAALLDRAERTWSLKCDGVSEEVGLRSSSGSKTAGDAPGAKHVLHSRLKRRIRVETGARDLPSQLQQRRASTREEEVQLEDTTAESPAAQPTGPTIQCPHCEHSVPLVVMPQAQFGAVAENSVPRQATRLQHYSGSGRLPFGVTAQEIRHHGSDSAPDEE